MLSGFRRAGAKSLLVSGGFTFFTERLQAWLGLDYAVGNTLETSDGKLTGRLLGDIIGASEKAQRLDQLGRVARAQGGIVAAIGDGANDVPMLTRADVSVAYHAKPVVRSRTTYAIDHCGLDAMLNLFV